MKKILLALAAVLWIAAGVLNAQVLYTDDFESYTVGQGIAAEEDGDVWNTWSGNPGSSEDPTVSDAYAHSGTQSIVVQGSNDGVIEFDDLTTNRYRVEFYLYIPDGLQGYYNIMQNFNPSGTGLVWGMQIFFQEGTGTIDGNGAAAKTFPYESDTWIKMQHFIDLDNDWVDMYINDELVHAYQWSHGTFNDGTGINKLDAFNFYAWNEGGTCQYYMDDFLIEQVAIPNPPTSFSAVLQGDNNVLVSWDAPSEGTPDSYSVIRDGEEIAVVTDATTYLDEGLYPGTYEYQLKAYYGQAVGYSASAGSEEITVEGGNERQLVLYEIFTGTWCPYCPTAADAIDMMADENLNVAIIEYHGLNGDIYETPATATRSAFYLPFYDDGDGGLGYPTTVINGMNAIEGALPSVADHNEFYDYWYDEYMDKPTVHTLGAEINLVSSNPYVFDISVDAEETFAYWEDEMRLFVALTETNIPESWQGQSEVNFVLRDMLPDANGTVLNFNANSTVTETFQLTVDASYEISNCEVVIFIQNMENAYVMETYKASLVDFVGIADEQQELISVYPNPASDNISVATSANIEQLSIYTLTGKLLVQTNPESSLTNINTQELSAGIYLLKVETADKTYMQRVVVE